jgi:hypothetical protein
VGAFLIVILLQPPGPAFTLYTHVITSENHSLFVRAASHVPSRRFQARTSSNAAPTFPSTTHKLSLEKISTLSINQYPALNTRVPYNAYEHITHRSSRFSLTPTANYRHPRRRRKTTMINPSKALNVQDGRYLFKLAAETRNQIYELVFSLESEKDEEGNIELSRPTAAPSNALIRTCQQIYNESHAMFRLASYDYPAIHNFTISVPNRRQRLTVPALSQHFFDRLESFSVTWRADEHNNGKPLHLTTYFSRKIKRYHFTGWDAQVKMHDKYWTPLPQSNRNVRRITSRHCFWIKQMMGGFYPFKCPSEKKSPSEVFASAVYKVAYPGAGEEGWIWGDTSAENHLIAPKQSGNGRRSYGSNCDRITLV